MGNLVLIKEESVPQGRPTETANASDAQTVGGNQAAIAILILSSAKADTPAQAEKLDSNVQPHAAAATTLSGFTRSDLHSIALYYLVYAVILAFAAAAAFFFDSPTSKLGL